MTKKTRSYSLSDEITDEIARIKELEGDGKKSASSIVEWLLKEGVKIYHQKREEVQRQDNVPDKTQLPTRPKIKTQIRFEDVT